MRAPQRPPPFGPEKELAPSGNIKQSASGKMVIAGPEQSALAYRFNGEFVHFSHSHWQPAALCVLETIASFQPAIGHGS